MQHAGPHARINPEFSLDIKHQESYLYTAVAMRPLYVPP